MVTRKYRYKPNETVVIEADLHEEKPAKPSQKGMLHYEEPEYPGRRTNLPPIWDFFDLGTRLRTVDTPSDFTNGFRAIDATDSPSTDPAKTLEYVETMFDAPGEFADILQGDGVPATGEYDVYSLASNHLQVDIVDETKLTDWDESCLGLSMGDTLDPFGTTRLEAGGARKIPNCMPIWYGKDDQPDNPATYLNSSGFQSDDFDVELYKDTTVDKYPNSKLREIVSDLGHWWRSSISQSAFLQDIWDAMTIVHNLFWQSTLNTDGDYEDERKDHEIWNPLSLTQNSIDISKRGRMNMKEATAGSDFNLRLQSRLIYEPFDTGDTTNYKVTTQPSFESDEVPFKTARKSEMKFYLKPQWLGFFREGSYSNSRNLSYQTFRVRQISGPYAGTWFNIQNALQVPYSGDSGGFGNPWHGFEIEFSPFALGDSHFNVDGPVYDQLNYSLNGLDGSWTITSNSIGSTGTVSISGTARFIPVGGGPGYWFVDTPNPPPFDIVVGGFAVIGSYQVRMTWREGSSFDSITAPNDSIIGTISGSSYLPSPWGGLNAGIGTFAEIFRGTHIGRFPVFPRIIGTNNEWNSPVIRDTESTTTYADGTMKTYIPDTAKDMEGRVVNWDFGNYNYAREIYERHVFRDTKEIIKHTTVTQATPPPPVGSQTPVPCIGGSLTWKDIQNYGAGITAWNAQADTFANSINSCFSGAHIRNKILGTPTISINEYGTMYAVPLDARVGTLCGVIIKGTNKYYIWRKTSEVRGGFDYDRNQAIAFYSGSLD
jgi:hypothetical protein